MTNEEELFERYLQELITWNEKFNLTAVTAPAEIKIRHFEDSLSILQVIDLKDQKVVDIGSGAGFPGIPLKIVRPNISLVLMDSTRKKIDFLSHIIKELKLENVNAVWGRAEELAKKPYYGRQFDIALARAIAKFPKLLLFALPLLKKGGVFVAQKQEHVEQEINDSKLELKKLGGKIRKIKKVVVGGIIRSLVVVEKV
ncbi:16S rRNA (guanine(527)-N(7))-methyltransferase RsmG [candidate division WOR-1 bacterium RIFOXYA2_FULL_36_21]|uniref:Ribosomal RNA small subunit methyltransferase G n=1 Tax=candidate division WOR-1 bacterium RIFOXYB2_FULL_36_35 TaxID=1802578 RepID=A0A1F4S1L7_UNCSA|nr:MAG: 16S rRNA (guanine(527)-N(7))-methyltransferase RsmG [candidate division WOR-1 bacterium RIFOXYA2_FULL_36_21]OGC14322.1 MAG: 16S rRNA (guanine(527)-N(7))-methyltransferase RsmG [candidate division WOR-1 bacterium RIFOXYB2_FULL_36_35]OGC19646.1 MAG: 16S rRNA (guanine(527)-N(7))-methyltransferase RsmG [candidate division WOR-1 bacterium RIFOXYA12_FULL_36_13]